MTSYHVFLHKLPSDPHQLAFYLNLAFFMPFYLTYILTSYLPFYMWRVFGSMRAQCQCRAGGEGQIRCTFVNFSRPETVAGAEKKTLTGRTHDGSMVLLYMVTWIRSSIYPLYVSIYTSTMDPMGNDWFRSEFL